jgi:hypothetical protein
MATNSKQLYVLRIGQSHISALWYGKNAELRAVTFSLDGTEALTFTQQQADALSEKVNSSLRIQPSIEISLAKK